MTEKAVRCAIYTRKSTEDGLDQEFNSLDAQREACEAYIKSQASQGWKVVDERFDDGGFSGGNLERPAVKRLIDQVKKRRIQVIVVYKIDRLTRSLADFARLVEVLDQHDASFVSVTQQFNTTTSMGRLTLNVLLSFAQFEREVTSERIRDKVAASKRRGMWMGGHPPLGYDIMNRKLVVNEREAKTVRHIFTLACEIQSVAKLQERLATDGVTAKRWKTQTAKMMGGGPFTRSTLSRLLRNPVYLGKVRQAGALYEGEHEAIIDETLWGDVQRMLEDNVKNTRTAKNTKSNALLAGLLYDDAGNRMVPSHARKGETVYRYYTSAPLMRGSKAKVGAVSRVSAPRIECEIIDALNGAKIAPPGASEIKLLRLIDKIILHPAEIELRLNDGGCNGGLLRVAADLRSAKNGIRIIEEHGANQRSESLVKAIALAHDWRKQMERGSFQTIKALADAKGLSDSYVWKILRLSYLAPDIVEAILDGRQPSHLSLHQINAAKLSGDWNSQRRALDFPTLT